MSIKYQIWFTWNAEREKIRLPVLPEKFSIKNGSNNQSIDLTGLGEITIMQSRPALQFSFSSFFPAGYFPGIKSIIAVPPMLISCWTSLKAGAQGLKTTGSSFRTSFGPQKSSSPSKTCPESLTL